MEEYTPLQIREYTPLQIREDNDCVVLPRKEYDALIRARMGIDTIGASETKYGFDSYVIRAVLKLFGYEHKEDSDA